MPGAPSSFLLLVVRPGAPSSVLAPRVVRGDQFAQGSAGCGACSEGECATIDPSLQNLPIVHRLCTAHAPPLTRIYSP